MNDMSLKCPAWNCSHTASQGAGCRARAAFTKPHDCTNTHATTVHTMHNANAHNDNAHKANAHNANAHTTPTGHRA